MRGRPPGSSIASGRWASPSAGSSSSSWTSVGVETRAEMLAATYAAPPELMQMDAAGLAALRNATTSLPRRRGSSG